MNPVPQDLSIDVWERHCALEDLEDATGLEWQDGVRSLLSDYDQQPLPGFCIEILMAQDQEAPELPPERIGMEMIWLKTVIDCFDQ